MNKKITTIIISVACLIITGIVVTGVLIKERVIRLDTLFNNSQNSTVSNLDNNEKTEESTEPVYEVRLAEGAEYIIKKFVAVEDNIEGADEDVYVKFDSCKITKSLGNFDWEDRYNKYATIDENGNITSNDSYVAVNVTIENLGDIPFSTTVNCMGIVFGRDYPKSTEYWSRTHCGEVISYNSNKEKPYKKDYFFERFEKNDVRHFTLAYIIPDDILDEYNNDIYLIANCMGQSTNSTPPLIDKQD